jgi:nucleotide-binding universal stress UspA family protein
VSGNGHRILCLYDGSTVSSRALDAAIERARFHSTGITVLAVVPPRLWRAKQAQFQAPMEKHDEEFAKQQIELAKGVCKEAGVTVKGLLRAGAPLQVIVEESGKGFEAVVIGDRRSPTGAPSLAALVSPVAACEVIAIT